MGWTYTYRGRGESIHDFFAKQFNCENEHGSWKLLKTAVVKRKTAYMAFERIYPDGNKIVFGLVCLLGYAPKSYYNFGYKDMDETMGPYAYECPESILDMLTPTDNENANNWRKSCREYIAKRKALKFKVGNIVEFDSPIAFRNGIEFKRLKVFKVKPLEFIPEDDVVQGFRYTVYKCNKRTLISQNAKVVG